MSYPAPGKPKWRVAIEMLDGTRITGIDDVDVFDRWRRVASWSDPEAERKPVQWLQKILDRCRVFYGAGLIGITVETDPALILDALFAEGCIATLQRQ